MGTLLNEVVYVIDAEHLVDSESYQRDYRSGQPLAPGCNVVHWTRPANPLRYDEAAEFIGPYASRQVAEAAARQPDPVHPPDH